MNAIQKKEKEQKWNIKLNVVLIVFYYFANALIMTSQDIQFIFTLEWWGLHSLAVLVCILVFIVYYKAIE